MIYLDHAAATPLDTTAFKAMQPFFFQDFFNPSSPYIAAKETKTAYQEAKTQLARLLGAKASDLVITSGATESNNLALSIARPFLDRPGAVLMANTEHASLLASVPATLIKTNQNGLINLKDFKEKLTKDTVLVSVALANNELGTIQPLSKIGAIIKAEQQRRLLARESTPLYFHSDASQGFALLETFPARLNLDLMTISSAKIYGPKGVGALYFSPRVKLTSQITGGGQELGLRSGTENVPGLIGFSAAAVNFRKHRNSHQSFYLALKELFKRELADAKIPPVFLGDPKRQLANFCPFSFPGIDAERLIYRLERQKIYLSTGAACAAAKNQKSHVLAATGLDESIIAGSLRATFGRLNTPQEISTAATIIKILVASEIKRLSL